MTREGRIRFELEGDFKRQFVDVDDGDKVNLDPYTSYLHVDADDVGDTEDASVIMPHPALNPGAVYHIEVEDVGDGDVLIRDDRDNSTIKTMGSDGHVTFMSVGVRYVEIG